MLIWNRTSPVSKGWVIGLMICVLVLALIAPVAIAAKGGKGGKGGGAGDGGGTVTTPLW